jgi:hypothetical protein
MMDDNPDNPILGCMTSLVLVSPFWLLVLWLWLK